MAISRHGNTIIVPAADSGVALAVGMGGEIIGAKVKTAGVVGRMIVYNGQAVDATKVITDTGDVPINDFGGLTGLKNQYRDGINVQVTGAGAVGYVYLR